MDPERVLDECPDSVTAFGESFHVEGEVVEAVRMIINVNRSYLS